MKRENLIAIGVGVLALIFLGFIMIPQNRSPVQKWQGWGKDVKPLIVAPKRQQEQQPDTVGGYKNALEIARMNNKSVLLIFGADWCKWCTKLEQETLSKPKVQQAMKYYVVYYVNTDREREIAAKYGISGVPVYMIVTPNERIVKRGEGFKGEILFLFWLK